MLGLLTKEAKGSLSRHSRLRFWSFLNRLWCSKVIGSAAMYSSIPCFLALSASPWGLLADEAFPLVTGGAGRWAWREASGGLVPCLAGGSVERHHPVVRILLVLRGEQHAVSLSHCIEEKLAALQV
jgi:hypothetical protein